jgi:hypothetical protein
LARAFDSERNTGFESIAGCSITPQALRDFCQPPPAGVKGEHDFPPV